MKFIPGDKVCFLNEKGEGIVKKILGNGLVLVEIEEGFEIPVLEKDLLKISSPSDKPASDKNPDKKSLPDENKTDEIRFPDRFELFADEQSKLDKGIYLAFIPEDQQVRPGKNLAVYLVNHDSPDVLFTYALMENEEFVCRDFDRIDESTALLLDIVDIAQIENWKELSFQFLFFKKGFPLVKNPLQYQISVKAVKFYQENNYIFRPVLNDVCFLIPIRDNETRKEAVQAEKEWVNNKIEKPKGPKIVGHINNYYKKAEFPQKHILTEGVAEVDLHIGEIMENFSGLENYEIVRTQVDYFLKLLEQAMAAKFRRIIFIHGIGDGILRQEIISKLQNYYPTLKYSDASFSRYGKGAIEITLS